MQHRCESFASALNEVIVWFSSPLKKKRLFKKQARHNIRTEEGLERKFLNGKQEEKVDVHKKTVSMSTQRNIYSLGKAIVLQLQM